LVKLATGDNAIPAIPVETFDLTQFCTSRHHAFMVGKYFLALRKLVTHTVTFSTTIDGLDLGPGDFIKVITEASPYTPASLGTVSSTGVITSASTIEDGTYPVSYYTNASQDVLGGEMQVSSGTVTDSTFFNAIFTITRPSVSENIYLVEQLTFEEDMTIRIVASEYPCDSAQASELAKLVVDDAAFTAQGPS
jgi:predicted phage tail protein